MKSPTEGAFIHLIDTVQKNTKAIVLQGAMKWIDENYDEAWSKAMDRFDLALAEAIRTKNAEKAKMEAQIYKASIEGFIETFKRAKGEERTLNLFDRLKQEQKT